MAVTLSQTVVQRRADLILVYPAQIVPIRQQRARAQRVDVAKQPVLARDELSRIRKRKVKIVKVLLLSGLSGELRVNAIIVVVDFRRLANGRLQAKLILGVAATMLLRRFRLLIIVLERDPARRSTIYDQAGAVHARRGGRRRRYGRRLGREHGDFVLLLLNHLQAVRVHIELVHVALEELELARIIARLVAMAAAAARIFGVLVVASRIGGVRRGWLGYFLAREHEPGVFGDGVGLSVEVVGERGQGLELRGQDQRLARAEVYIIL